MHIFSHDRYTYFIQFKRQNLQIWVDFTTGEIFFPHQSVRKIATFVNHFIFFSKECPPGLWGKNCSNMCEYPTFGIRCAQLCPCEKQLCNFMHGCTNGKYFFLIHSFIF